MLTLLLAAEGLTLLDLGPLRVPHMFIGIALIPPVLVKLGSTGYRFARYYAGTRPYREKGPPLMPLRLLAPVLVAATLGVFSTGVALLIAGRRTGWLLQLHQASFIVWAAAFGIHFLAYLPTMARSLGSDWTTARRREIPGSGLRARIARHIDRRGSRGGGGAPPLDHGMAWRPGLLTRRRAVTSHRQGWAVP